MNRYPQAKSLPLFIFLMLSYSALAAQSVPFNLKADTSGMSRSGGILDAKPYFFDGLKALETNDIESALEFFSMAHTLKPEQAGLNYALAETYLRMGDLTSAAYHAKAAIQADSTNKWYWLKLASIYRSSAQLSDALQAHEKAMELDPKNPTLLLNKAALLQSMNRTKEAILALEEVMLIKGEDATILLDIYQLYRESNEEEKAIESLNRLIELVPEEIRFQQELAQLYLEQEKYDEAINLFEKRVNAYPNDTGSSLLLIESYYKAGRDADGLDRFEKIWERSESKSARMRIAQYMMVLNSEVSSPESMRAVEKVLEWIQDNATENPQSLAMAIDYLLQNGQASEALPLLEQITQQVPENDVAWRQYLQILYSEGEYKRVIEKGRLADESVPDDAFITFFVGSAYQISGQSSEALNWLERSSNIPAEPSFRSIVHGSLGDALAAKKNWEEAFKVYEKALQFDPTNDNVLNNYAYYISVSKIGNLEEAREMAEKANEMRPNLASYMDTLGWILHLQGDHKEAEKWIKGAVETGDASATVKENLGDVYEALGNMKEAKKWWQQALDADPSRTHLKERLE